MPWSSTRAFPHPLTNVNYTTSSRPLTNYLSYDLVELMTWEGLGDIINNFRKNTLGLPKLTTAMAPSLLRTLQVPHTYTWSEALIPKPKDWGPYIDVCGFFFLDLASNYTPPPDLVAFLEGGDPPVYIGFGSIVVDDPDGMTELVFQAVDKAGVRALVSKGWGGLGGDKLKVPDNVYLIGNCPHDWLFTKVSAVVHHGGAGTTAAGLKAGKPTVIVPFFGDQPFWGAMIASIGAGPAPVPYKRLTADRLASAIKFALTPEVAAKARTASIKIQSEDGVAEGVRSFHRHLPLDAMRCDVDPTRLAEVYVEDLDLKVSRWAAEILIRNGRISINQLMTYRYAQWDPESAKPPFDTGSGAVSVGGGADGGSNSNVSTMPASPLIATRRLDTSAVVVGPGESDVVMTPAPAAPASVGVDNGNGGAPKRETTIESVSSAIMQIPSSAAAAQTAVNAALREVTQATTQVVREVTRQVSATNLAQQVAPITHMVSEGYRQVNDMVVQPAVQKTYEASSAAAYATSQGVSSAYKLSTNAVTKTQNFISGIGTSLSRVSNTLSSYSPRKSRVFTKRRVGSDDIDTTGPGGIGALPQADRHVPQTAGSVVNAGTATSVGPGVPLSSSSAVVDLGTASAGEMTECVVLENRTAEHAQLVTAGSEQLLAAEEGVFFNKEEAAARPLETADEMLERFDTIMSLRLVRGETVGGGSFDGSEGGNGREREVGLGVENISRV
ncbi:hypothetical protein HDU76_001218 [Blyttiomyces sp. JEL0837]|nr:hypothetical protein HDU76_001218 [Blyttiomyces sp. JEL0837]